MEDDGASYEPLVGEQPKRTRRLLPFGIAALFVTAAAAVLVGFVAWHRQDVPMSSDSQRRYSAHRGHFSPPPPPPFAPPPPPLPLPECFFAKNNGELGQSATRKIEFVNECEGRLHVNLQGFTWPDPSNFSMHELPNDGGFALAAGKRVTYDVSERLFSGRIWARPNCTSPCDPKSCGPKGTMWCDTGNCPGANQTTCRGLRGEFIGGLPPGPLLELTLCGGRGANLACYVDAEQYNEAACNAMPFSDFYDLSNVDGMSKVWASLEQLGGRKLKGGGAPEGDFNCGSPRMNGPFDFAQCPQPMRISRNDSDAFGFSANATVDKAIGCLSACSFMALVGKQYMADRSMVPHRNMSNAEVGMVTLDDIAATCCECGHGVNNGICPTPYPNGSWPAPNDKCIAGCSPFGAYPKSYKPSQCTTAHMPSIFVDKNESNQIKLGEVQAIFKAYAPNAYSWQFDDFKSTYLCEQADFRVTFCPAPIDD
jgi:hypothetical protein